MVVTKSRFMLPYVSALMLIILTVQTVHAAILPEDQTDILYHRYEGGGIVIDGPSVLIRKQFKDTVSVWGNYYTDSISGASIDLLSRGSTYYEEERTEQSLGFDYLRDRTILSVSHTNSSERDYEANSYAFAVSQEFFGDMTTLSLNYSQGNDEVRENIYENEQIIDTVFRGDARHQRFGLGLTQVLTPKWIVAFNAETVVDEGFLNNPYRTVRYINDAGGSSDEKEKYPETRNSDAFAVRTMYYLPYRAALRLEYRTYVDSWDINADNYEIRYIHPYKDQWIFEAKYRAYSQSQADFYADLFPYENAQAYLARDKEMSEFSNSAIGLSVSYEFKRELLPFIDKTSINLSWDHITFDYANFRENTPENTEEFTPGNEPFYGFTTNVVRFFVSLKY